MTQVFQCGGVVTYQLLCGREIAGDHPFARQMANFVYLVVNTQDRTAIAVDAAWDVDGLYDLADSLGVQIRGSVYTHFHFDHCGGRLHPSVTGGRAVPPVQGAKEVQQRGGQVWVCSGDASAMKKQCDLESLTTLEDGDALECGDLILHVLRTPGHTPGSICIFASPQCLSPRGHLKSALPKEQATKAEAGMLIAGDTLFVGSCGRADLPGSNQMHMFESLSRISNLSPEVVVLPGHDYGSRPFSTLALERQVNMYMQAGLSQVPRPPPLPPCCAAALSGTRRGPRNLVVGRKVRLLGRARCQGAPAAEVSQTAAEDEEARAILDGFDDQGGEYAVRLLPTGEEQRVPPDGVAALSKPSNL